jgi:hypothetical protein
MRLLDCSLKLSVESSDKRRESEPVTYEPESLGISECAPRSIGLPTRSHR